MSEKTPKIPPQIFDACPSCGSMKPQRKERETTPTGIHCKHYCAKCGILLRSHGSILEGLLIKNPFMIDTKTDEIQPLFIKDFQITYPTTCKLCGIPSKTTYCLDCAAWED